MGTGCRCRGRDRERWRWLLQIRMCVWVCRGGPQASYKVVIADLGVNNNNLSNFPRCSGLLPCVLRCSSFVWAGLRGPGFALGLSGSTESQNHRMVGVGRDLCGSSSPTLLPKQGHLHLLLGDGRLLHVPDSEQTHLLGALTISCFGFL